MINSLATYCRVNKFGYIESPYKKVVDGKVTSEIKYLSAIEEEKFTIAQANSALNKDGSFIEELVACRKNLNFELSSRENIDYIDVSPKQLVSVAAALIPAILSCASTFLDSNPSKNSCLVISPFLNARFNFSDSMLNLS